MSHVRTGQLRQLLTTDGVAMLILVMDPDPDHGNWWRCMEWGYFSWAEDHGEVALRNRAWLSTITVISEPQREF